MTRNDKKNLYIKSYFKTLLCAGMGLLTIGCAKKSDNKTEVQIKPFVVVRTPYVTDDGHLCAHVVDVDQYETILPNGLQDKYDTVEWWRPAEFYLELGGISVARTLHYGDVLDLEVHMPGPGIYVPEKRLLLNQSISIKRKSERILKERQVWIEANNRRPR